MPHVLCCPVMFRPPITSDEAEIADRSASRIQTRFSLRLLIHSGKAVFDLPSPFLLTFLKKWNFFC